MSQLEEATALWDGMPLAEGPIGLKVDNEDQHAGSTARRSLVAVSSTDSTCVVPAERVGEFLQNHAQRDFDCDDAADVHWRILELLPAAGGVRELLWQIARDGRLVDSLLLKQRKASVASGFYVHSGSALGGAPPREWPKTSSHYGEFGIGVDVQAVIAVAASADVAIDVQLLPQLQNELDELHRHCCGMLRKNKSAYKCFDWIDELIESSGGQIQYDERRLRTWLEKRFWRLLDYYGRPFVPPWVERSAPKVKDDRFSVDQLVWFSLKQRHWVGYTPFDETLRAWSDVFDIADVRRFMHKLPADVSLVQRRTALEPAARTSDYLPFSVTTDRSWMHTSRWGGDSGVVTSLAPYIEIRQQERTWSPRRLFPTTPARRMLWSMRSWARLPRSE